MTSCDSHIVDIPAKIRTEEVTKTIFRWFINDSNNNDKSGMYHMGFVHFRVLKEIIELELNDLVVE